MTHIHKREFVGQVISSASGAFVIQSYDINPGLPFSFPWSCDIANNHLKYRYKALGFELESTSAIAQVSGTNTQLGIWGMIWKYDPTMPSDLTYLQIMNQPGVTKGAPYKTLHMMADCSKQSHNAMTIRAGAQPAGTDLRMYDFGFLEVFSFGCPSAANVLGNLYVHYDVEFDIPNYIQGEIGYTIRTSSNGGGFNVTNAAPFGSAGNMVQATNNFLPLTFTSTTCSFPVDVTTGLYDVWIMWGGGAAVTWVPPGVTYANCSNVPLGLQTATGAPNEATTVIPFSGALVTTIALLGFTILVNAPGSTVASFTLSGAGTVPTTSYCYCIVQQRNGLMNVGF